MARSRLEQLVAAGLKLDGDPDPHPITARLVHLLRGVYAVGDPELMPLVRRRTALAARSEPARSSATARPPRCGDLLQSNRSMARPSTVVGRNLRSRPGIRLHRVGAALNRR